MNAKDRKEWSNERNYGLTGIYSTGDITFEESKDIQTRCVKGQTPPQIANTYGLSTASVRKALCFPDLKIAA
jgi:hypothetical protein